MRGVWDALGDDPDSIDCFLRELAEAAWHVSRAADFSAAYDSVGLEENAVANAVDVLVRYCEHAKDRDLEPELNGLAVKLRKLERLAHETATLDRISLRILVPASRKSRRDFLWRVHFAKLMVLGMTSRFGSPDYQLVAAAMNVFCDFPEHRQVTADSVRNAWRRNALHIRRTARPTRRQSCKPAAHSARKIAAQ